MTVHRIIITPSLNSNANPRHSSRGPQYDVTYGGETIVTCSTQPLLNACRVLKAWELSGPIEMWDNVLPYCRLMADIDKAAGQNIREGDEPPRYEKFKSFTRVALLEAFSEPQATPTAAEREIRSTAHSPPIAGE